MKAVRKGPGVRRSLTVTLVLLGSLAASVATALPVQPLAFCTFEGALVDDCLLPGNLQFGLDGQVLPSKLPQREMAPVALKIEGSVWTADGTHPPALREAILAFDKNAAIDAEGLPVCALRRVEGRLTSTARSACRDAIVGDGSAQIQIGQPETRPTQASARLTLFNGGVRAGTMKLLIHATVGLPEPASAVATVETKKALKGRYGWTSVVKTPRLLEGTGSLISFELRIGRRFLRDDIQRSYLSARCFDGRLQAQATKAVFKQEATGARTTTTLSRLLLKPCTRTGPANGT
jgi:hypothetical protein